jgi:hypothetical protein
VERNKKEADMIGRGVREVVGCNRVSVTAIRFLDEFLSCCAHTLDTNPSNNAKRAYGVDARTSVGEGNDCRDIFTDGANPSQCRKPADNLPKAEYRTVRVAS